jgi:hypothetical protein
MMSSLTVARDEHWIVYGLLAHAHDLVVCRVGADEGTKI